MDISSFMTWWVQQVVSIITFTYSTMDSIQFAGTSLFRVCLGVLILGNAIPLLLTLTISSKYGFMIGSERRRAKENNDNESK